MSKKATKIDELAELVLEDKVVNVLVPRLTPLLTPIMETIVQRMAAEITKEVTAALTKTMESLCRENFEKTNVQLSMMNERLKQLEDHNTSLAGKMEEMERHSKLSNLIIHGITPSNLPTLNDDLSLHQRTQRETEHSLTSAIVHLCQSKLSLSITEHDISTVHRLPSSANNPNGPVIVNFASRRARNDVYNARKLLRSTAQYGQAGQPKERIYINEHLTRSSARLYAAVRKLVKEKVVASTWTYGGIVFAKKSTEPDASPLKILTTDDLGQLTSTLT